MYPAKNRRFVTANLNLSCIQLAARFRHNMPGHCGGFLPAGLRLTQSVAKSNDSYRDELASEPEEHLAAAPFLPPCYSHDCFVLRAYDLRATGPAAEADARQRLRFHCIQNLA